MRIFSHTFKRIVLVCLLLLVCLGSAPRAHAEEELSVFQASFLGRFINSFFSIDAKDLITSTEQYSTKVKTLTPDQQRNVSAALKKNSQAGLVGEEIAAFRKIQVGQSFAAAQTKTETKRGDAAKVAEINAECSVQQVGGCIKQGMAWIASILLYIMSIVLVLAAALFELSLRVSIIDFAAYANSPGITTVWQVTRDMSNMFFIFIMLYIAICTVLQVKVIGGDWKGAVVKVIIAAVMVNFSALVAKLIIDPTNIIAAEFHQQLKEAGKNTQFGQIARTAGLEGTGVASSAFAGGIGIAGIFVDGMDLTSIYNLDTKADTGDSGLSTARGRQQAANITGGVSRLSLVNIIVSGLGGSFLVLIAAFVFFTAAALFIFRTVVLLIVIATAPIAFIAPLIPQLSKKGDQWWDHLINQSLYAPAYMFAIYMTAQVIHAPGGELKALVLGETNGGLLDGLFGGGVDTLIFFALVIGFMLSSLYIAKEFGAVGLGQATSFGKSATNFTKNAVSRATGVNALQRGINQRVTNESASAQRLLSRIPVVGGSASTGLASLTRGVQGFTNQPLTRLGEQLGGVSSFNPLATSAEIEAEAGSEIDSNLRGIRGMKSDNTSAWTSLSSEEKKDAYKKMTNNDRLKLEDTVGTDASLLAEVRSFRSGLEDAERVNLEKLETDRGGQSRVRTEGEKKLKEAIDTTASAADFTAIEGAYGINKANLWTHGAKAFENPGLLDYLTSGGGNVQQFTSNFARLDKPTRQALATKIGTMTGPGATAIAAQFTSGTPTALKILIS